ncbi:MAG: cysteine--tRNA ligase [Candidatus Paceibacterota bacterium]
MTLKVYNTLTDQKEEFHPLNDKEVKMFVCGPTVYDYAHIGHARTYVVFDMITKYLRQKDYDVYYLQNITDIDDKIIKRAKKKDITPKELARKYEKAYLKDMEKLNVNSIDKYARATEHIDQIISQVKRLKEKDYAYKLEDGFYYDLSKFEDYGKLSGRTTLDEEDAVSRIDEAKDKKNKRDFCLWKDSKPEEPSWESPWGEGRPGWHIEDTALTEKYLGPQYDLHGGARDLIFPHHEAEIAQMEALSGKKPMVKYWTHAGFLTVNGEKMSKSEGNFITIRDFLKDYSPRVLRLFVLKSHYRSPVDYNEEVLKQVKNQIEKIDEFLDRLKEYEPQSEGTDLVQETREKYRQAMEDDFNTPEALAAVFELIKKANSALDKNELNQENKRNIVHFLNEVDQVFDFIFVQKQEVPDQIKKLAQKREKLRKQEKYEEADELRKKIEEKGYQVKDTDQGIKIRKK